MNKTCLICRKESDSVLQYSFFVPSAKVCGFCAEEIANAFNMAHSGSWLTWPTNNTEKHTHKRNYNINPKLRKEVYERDLYRCQKCGTHKDLSIDHVHPVILGGTDEISNLQTLCISCNCSKGART